MVWDESPRTGQTPQATALGAPGDRLGGGSCSANTLPPMGASLEIEVDRSSVAMGDDGESHARRMTLTAGTALSVVLEATTLEFEHPLFNYYGSWNTRSDRDRTEDGRGDHLGYSDTFALLYPLFRRAFRAEAL